MEGFFDRDLDIGCLVGARYWSPAPAAAASKQPAEQVVEVDVLAAGKAEVARGLARAPSPGTGASPGPCPSPLLGVDVLGYLPELRAERIVAAPGVRVGQDGVSLRYVLETILGPWVLIDIRMMSPRELSVRALDLILTGIP